MLFEFRRDEEGREDIRVGGVCVAVVNGDKPRFMRYEPMQVAPGATDAAIVDAIERADEAGFWAPEPDKVARKHGLLYLRDEVTVEVPVADNVVLSITLSNDES